MTTLPKSLTQDELKRFFAAIDSPHDRATCDGTTTDVMPMANQASSRAVCLPCCPLV
jgi:hypothetical protein